MNDWNHNGQFAPGDSFIDYQIYKEVMKSGDRKPSSGSGCLTAIISALAIVAVVVTAVMTIFI